MVEVLYKSITHTIQLHLSRRVGDSAEVVRADFRQDDTV